jgi:hypothetical protein
MTSHQQGHPQGISVQVFSHLLGQTSLIQLTTSMHLLCCKMEAGMTCVLNVLRLNAENQQQIGEYEQMQASLLQKLLLKCLESHVAKKVNTDKQNNWCLYFTASKLGHMAAIMVLLGHVKHDLGCIQSDMCLLAGKSTFSTSD